MIKRIEFISDEAYKIEADINRLLEDKNISTDMVRNIQETVKNEVYHIVIYYISR